MTTYEKWTLVGLWLGSVGTVGAVVYALFGAAMRRWFNKPKLELDISNKFPFCVKVKRGNASASNSDLDVVEICASLINTKKYCAQHSRVMCTGIYVLEANDKTFCPLIPLRPRQFQWVDVSAERVKSEIDIAQSVVHFVKIAEISKPQNEMAVNGQRSGAVKPASITIAVPNPNNPSSSYIRIPPEHKSVLIQMQVSCSGNSPICHNIRIDWKGSSVGEFEQPGKLKIDRIGDDEARNLITEPTRR